MDVHSASLDEREAVERIIAEYCDAIGVVLRDDAQALSGYFNDDAGVWLAYDGSEVVGCVVLRPLATRADACEIKRMYVREAYRGKGVADALLDALELGAIARGYRFAYLDTRDDRRAAVRLYERRGYRRCERYNDNPQATIFMRRELR